MSPAAVTADFDKGHCGSGGGEAQWMKVRAWEDHKDR